MLTGQDLHILNSTAALEVHKISLNPWADVTSDVRAYYEKFAELVNTHFTTSSTMQPQEPLVCDVYEQLAGMPQEKQALIYGFLHRIGHRIYK